MSVQNISDEAGHIDVLDMGQEQDGTWTIIFVKAVLVLYLRAGFGAIMWCSSPTTRCENAVAHLLADQAVASACYWLAGLPLVIGAWSPASPTEWATAVHGWCVVLVATGVLSIAAAGRLQFLSHLVVTAVFAGLVQPVLSRWVVPARDNGAAVAAHASGGALTLAAQLALGRRMVSADEVDDRFGCPGASVSQAALAYMLVAEGCVALGLPVPGRATTKVVPMNVGRSAVSASGGVLVELLVVATLRGPIDYWALLGVLQAGIAGLVTSSSVDGVTIPAVWMAVGMSGGLLYAAVSRLVFRSSLEDPANLMAVHLAPGLLAALWPPLLAPRLPETSLVGLGWQLAGALGVTAATLVFAIAVMLLMSRLELLRYPHEDDQHRRARARGYQPTEQSGQLLPGLPGQSFQREDSEEKSL